MRHDNELETTRRKRKTTAIWLEVKWSIYWCCLTIDHGRYFGYSIEVSSNHVPVVVLPFPARGGSRWDISTGTILNEFFVIARVSHFLIATVLDHDGPLALSWRPPAPRSSHQTAGKWGRCMRNERAFANQGRRECFWVWYGVGWGVCKKGVQSMW
jgi:hypothetical protein